MATGVEFSRKIHDLRQPVPTAVYYRLSANCQPAAIGRSDTRVWLAPQNDLPQLVFFANALRAGCAHRSLDPPLREVVPLCGSLGAVT
jgi:hypothetical protein